MCVFHVNTPNRLEPNRLELIYRPIIKCIFASTWSPQLCTVCYEQSNLARKWSSQIIWFIHYKYNFSAHYAPIYARSSFRNVFNTGWIRLRNCTQCAHVCNNQFSQWCLMGEKFNWFTLQNAPLYDTCRFRKKVNDYICMEFYKGFKIRYAPM